MKTYTTITKDGKLVATLSSSRTEAFYKIKNEGYKVSRTQILLSSVHLDYTTGIKL